MKFKKATLIVLLSFIAAGLFFASSATATELTRAEFAKAMETIKPGMTTAQVQDAIGKPDDIVTEYDPGGSFVKGAETWCYGTEGHLSFPTLGCVYLEKGKVTEMVGGERAPPDPQLIDEVELRKLLPLIDKAGNNNPLDLILAVNTLLPLGEDKALAAISEYLRVASPYDARPERYGAFLVLRLLFDVPDDPGYMPRMMVGAPQPAEPKDPKILPRFPLVVIDDVPLNLVYGYAMAGQGENAETHVEYFRKIGKLREHPLNPTSDPLSIMAKIHGTPQWLYGEKPGTGDFEMGPVFLANQLLTLVQSVYWLEPDSHGESVLDFTWQNWDRIAKVFAELPVKWDPKQNIYTYADGTSLPEVKQPVYRRLIWDLPSVGPDVRLILERRTPKLIDAIISNPKGEGDRKTTIRIYHPWNKRHSLAEFEMPDFNGQVWQESSEEIDLDAGSMIQADAVSKVKTETSPQFVP